VTEEARLGTREKREMRRGERTSEKIRVVRGAACGPADLSRSWMGTDDGNEGTETRPPRPRRPARSPRVYLPHHELFFSDDDLSFPFRLKSEPWDVFIMKK
jgi:hypothetical protein